MEPDIVGDKDNKYGINNNSTYWNIQDNKSGGIINNNYNIMGKMNLNIVENTCMSYIKIHMRWVLV